MGDLINLTFREHSVRQLGTFDDPWWVAKDVCDVLGIQNVSQALREMPENEKGICKVYTLGGKQPVGTINEKGLYRLVSRSNKPEAQEFQDWLFGEVLPSLRKHGCYPPPKGQAIVPGCAETAIAEFATECRQIIRAMSEHQIGLTTKVCDVEASVIRLDGRVAALESVQAAKRVRIPREVCEIHSKFIRESVYAGKCPCCEKRQIFEHGRFVGEREHAIGTGDWTRQHTWLVCKECNQGDLKRNRTGAGQHAFALYQSRLDDWSQSHLPERRQMKLFEQ